MQVSEIMIRYGELSTKGKNKNFFIQTLANNVRKKLKQFESIDVTSNLDRMHIFLNGEAPEPIIAELKTVFGIQSYSPVIKVERSIESAKEAVVSLIKQHFQKGLSFKINTRRSDKDFEYGTYELNQQLGAAVVEAFDDIHVQMKKPDLTARVEVRQKGIFISVETIDGLGGLPVGTAGKGMLMLSGGIDSPVAGYLSSKRGMVIEAVHFYSPPYTSPQALQKAKDLAAKLANYAGAISFIEVPFTAIQEAIKNDVPDSYSMTITRRMMMRLTDELRKRRDGLALVNGESLGQVASQTMESMLAINEVTSTPILRPLITMDKNDIIDIAKDIDTFDLATLPYEDCCTIFAPTKPKTRPDLSRVKELEEALDVEKLVTEALDGIKIEKINVKDNSYEQSEKVFDSLL